MVRKCVCARSTKGGRVGLILPYLSCLHGRLYPNKNSFPNFNISDENLKDRSQSRNRATEAKALVHAMSFD